MYNKLKEIKWIAIPGVVYVMKYHFENNGYTLLVTNLGEIYGEILSEVQVQERFEIENSLAKKNNISQYLENALEDALHGQKAIKVSEAENYICMTLDFEIMGIPLAFQLQPKILSSNEFRNHVMCPLLLNSLKAHCESIKFVKAMPNQDGIPCLQEYANTLKNLKEDKDLVKLENEISASANAQHEISTNDSSFNIINHFIELQTINEKINNIVDIPAPSSLITDSVKAVDVASTKQTSTRCKIIPYHYQLFLDNTETEVKIVNKQTAKKTFSKSERTATKRKFQL